MSISYQVEMNYWFGSQLAPFDATHGRSLLLRGMRSVLLHSRVAKAGPRQAAIAESFIESLRSLFTPSDARIVSCGSKAWYCRSSSKNTE
jgi:hypothetical protein